MKTGKIATGITVGICLFFIISAAHATNWVTADEYGLILVDVDSMRKGTDGLVSYTSKKSDLAILPTDDLPVKLFREAVDCQNGISYFNLDDPDWRYKGNKVGPDTLSAVLMKFICTRVR